MNSPLEPNEGSAAPAAPLRSGAAAACLSFLFPGLGQAYQGRRDRAILFAAPVMALITLAASVLVTSGSSAGIRVLDPAVSSVLVIVVVAFGLWWIAAVVDAWQGGWHKSVASRVLVSALVLTVALAGAFGAVQLWRVHDAGIQIATRDPLDETAPPPTPGPTPMPLGETPDPQATPTQRPPDYIDPSDDPPNEPQPIVGPGPTPAIDIAAIDPHDDGLLNVLLVGLDWQPGRESKRTDTMLVVSANSDTGEVLMFSFPRDTAQFPLYNGGTYQGKLNTFAGFANRNPESYPEGGLKALAYEIGYLLGIPIDYYASVNMPGFMSVVELVGGVTVTNASDIHDDVLQFYLSPGTYRLYPADALRYVRSRHGSGGDFGRAERQQQVLAALRKELLKPENLLKIGDIAEALAQVVSTNFPLDQLDQLVALADQVEAEPSQSWVFKFPEWGDHLPRTDTCGRSVIYLRMDRIAELSIQVFGAKSLWNDETPPGPPPPTDCPAPERTPTPTP